MQHQFLKDNSYDLSNNEIKYRGPGKYTLEGFFQNENYMYKNKDLIYLSDNDYIDFKEQIKKSLADKEKFKKIRIEYAFSNSWDKKFIEIERIINNALLNLGFISQD